MKIIFVIHGINNKVIETACKKKQIISEQMRCDVDSCVYAEKKELENLQLESLGGRIYTLPVMTFATETVAQSLCRFVREKKYTAVIVADGCQSGDLAARLADLLEVQCVTAVTEISVDHESVSCKKMVYNNIACASYRLPLEFVISERFLVRNISGEYIEPLEIVKLEPCDYPDYILSDMTIEERKEQVVSPILIVAGMGIQSKEEIVKLREYARRYGFSFGVSRPVAMRGWADISEIIGVSGEIYSPKLTVAIGISGAAAFMAGIEQSNYILSVNSNPDAMIAKLSDAIIVDEYQNVLSDLLEYLKQWRQIIKEKDC